MTDSRATSRYVKSLLDLAVEQKALEPVHADMQLFSKVVDSSREFKLIQTHVAKPDYQARQET
jgi:F-type H+-transporting ATPase subunit delta